MVIPSLILTVCNRKSAGPKQVKVVFQPSIFRCNVMFREANGSQKFTGVGGFDHQTANRNLDVCSMVKCYLFVDGSLLLSQEPLTFVRSIYHPLPMVA